MRLNFPECMRRSRGLGRQVSSYAVKNQNIDRLINMVIEQNVISEVEFEIFITDKYFKR